MIKSLFISGAFEREESIRTLRRDDQEIDRRAGNRGPRGRIGSNFSRPGHFLRVGTQKKNDAFGPKSATGHEGRYGIGRVVRKWQRVEQQSAVNSCHRKIPRGTDFLILERFNQSSQLRSWVMFY
jgi:hypothetical protein